MNTETNNLWIVLVYALYLAVSLALTVWVARALHRNGRLFLVDALHGNEPLADSVNHLLVVGFYLINAGFVALGLKTAAEVDNVRVAIELLSTKLGLVLLVLGGMHFFNIGVISRFRRRALNRGDSLLPPQIAGLPHAPRA